ncbi:MAG: diguanylate cyclase [Trueperaceae bacterium]
MEGPGELEKLNEMAWERSKSAPAQALSMAEEAKAEARRLGDSTGLANSLRTIGVCRLELGELSEARRVLVEAETLLLEIPGVEVTLTDTRRALARACFLEQDFEQALRHVHDALQTAQDLADPRLRAAVANDAGMIYGRLGSYQEGLEFLLASLRILEEEGIPPAGNPFNNIGNIYLLQGDAERALEFFERAGSANDANGSGRDRVIALGNVGRALEALGDLEGAKREHERSLELARGLNDRLYLPAALTKLASVLGSLGEKEAAFECFREALALYDGRSSAFREETLMGLAQLHLKVGEPERAEPPLTQALECAKESHDRSLEGDANHGLAQVHRAAGRWQEAFECYQRYHELSTSVKHELFSRQAQALLLHNEVKQSKHDRQLLREMNAQLRAAYEELYEVHQALEAQTAELERLSLEDPLTKLFNRRHLERRMNDEIARLDRYGERFSIVMCDIDDFKAINDRHSHAVGDEILVQFAQILNSCTRETDVVARVGGEEFVLLLPHTVLAAAITTAEKVRSMVESFTWGGLRAGLSVTTSVGVTEAHLKCGAGPILEAADRELYRAKRLGKNSVCGKLMETGSEALT